MSRAGLGLAGYNLCIGGISLKLGSVVAVGLGGGLGGHSLGMAIEDEAVDIGEHVHLGLRSGVGAGGVGDAGLIHYRLANPVHTLEFPCLQSEGCLARHAGPVDQEPGAAITLRAKRPDAAPPWLAQ